MNTFPEEVLYKILTHLPPGYMLLVNKAINLLHNELYYKEILKKDYHELIMKPFSTWKDLYLRSREEGCVNFRQSGTLALFNKFIKGIKCFTCLPLSFRRTIRSSILLLRFNGDLLLINTIGEVELIDDGVSDICTSGYIKGNKFYGVFETNGDSSIDLHSVSIQLLEESTDDFLFISGENGRYVCAATQTKVYLYNHKLNNDQKCFSKSFDFKIRAIETFCVGKVDVLLETGKCSF